MSDNGNKGNQNPSKGVFHLSSEQRENMGPKAETKSAAALLSDLKENAIPKLELERERLWNERESLGLKKDLASYPVQTYLYPQRLEPKEALQMAIDKVGGDSFVQAKRNVERLEKLDYKIETLMGDVDRMYKGISRLTPSYIKKKNSLEKEQLKIREAYNISVIQYNQRVKELNTPETQKKIEKLAEDLLRNDIKREIKRKTLEKSFVRTEAHLERVYEAKRKLMALGDLKVPIRNISVKVGEERIKIPMPKKLDKIFGTEALTQKKTMRIR